LKRLKIAEPYKKRLREVEAKQIKEYIDCRGTVAYMPFEYIDIYLRKLTFFAKFPIKIRK